MDHGFGIVSKKIITKLNVIQTFSHLIVQEFQSLDASFEMLFFSPKGAQKCGGAREAENEINRSDYVKSRGWLTCIATSVGGAGIRTQMEGSRPATGSRLVHPGEQQELRACGCRSRKVER